METYITRLYGEPIYDVITPWNVSDDADNQLSATMTNEISQPDRINAIYDQPTVAVTRQNAPPKCFVFSWNTQSVDYSTEKGIVPDFQSELIERITPDVDIVAVGLQEETSRGSLISETGAITIALQQIRFKRVEYVDMMGWGVTTYKKLIREFRYEPRGLSLAVYVKSDFNLGDDDTSDTNEATETDTVFKTRGGAAERSSGAAFRRSSYTCPSFIQRLTKSKGGVAICINVPNFGRILFLNVHLPFDSSSIKRGENGRSRSSALAWQVTCLKYLYHTALDEFRPDYYFLMGDLNFRVVNPEISDPVQVAECLRDCVSSQQRQQQRCEYFEHDELKMLMSYSPPASLNGHRVSDFEGVPIMSEGVKDRGPLFFPTAKLRKGRNNQTAGQTVIPEYRMGLDTSRLPSWTDRILFQDLKEFERIVRDCNADDNDTNSREIITDCGIECLEYGRFDVGNMNLSDHAAVYGVFGE